jgi:hypothetical protein
MPVQSRIFWTLKNRIGRPGNGCASSESARWPVMRSNLNLSEARARKNRKVIPLSDIAAELGL